MQFPFQRLVFLFLVVTPHLLQAGEPAVGARIIPAQVLQRTRPQPPQLTKNLQMEVLVGVNGRVLVAKNRNCVNPQADQLGLLEVGQYLFRPAQENGKPMQAWSTIWLKMRVYKKNIIRSQCVHRTRKWPAHRQNTELRYVLKKAVCKDIEVQYQMDQLLKPMGKSPCLLRDEYPPWVSGWLSVNDAQLEGWRRSFSGCIAIWHPELASCEVLVSEIGETLKAPDSDFMDVQKSILVPAKLLKRFRPKYTRDLVNRGIGGAVELELSLDAHGYITEVILIHSNEPELAEISIKAANLHAYYPATKDGIPVSSTVRLKMRWEIVY